VLYLKDHIAVDITSPAYGMPLSAAKRQRPTYYWKTDEFGELEKVLKRIGDATQE
jgi:hypothetical protein